LAPTYNTVSRGGADDNEHALFERMHELWTERGYARLFAGLILSGRKIHRRMRGIFQEFARAMHQHRVQRRIEDRRPAPAWEDTAFSITLVWITLFGDALFGSIARASVGLSDDFATGHRFRRWMADRFEEAGPPRAASLIATPAAAAASESRGAPTRNRPSRRA
jgi:hypothetical protein